MFSIPVSGEQKAEQNFARESSGFYSNISSYSKKLLKGTIALIGFGAIGGITYAFSNWLRPKSYDSTSPTVSGTKIEELDADGNPIVAKDQSHNVAVTKNVDTATLVPSSAQVLSATESSIKSNTNQMAAVSDSNTQAKTTFNLEYREKNTQTTVDQEQDNKKIIPSAVRSLSGSLLGSGALSSNYTYLPVVELLNISNGWGIKINGEADCDFSGYSVSGAGDINGDGIDEWFIQ